LCEEGIKKPSLSFFFSLYFLTGKTGEEKRRRRNVCGPESWVCVKKGRGSFPLFSLSL